MSVTNVVAGPDLGPRYLGVESPLEVVTAHVLTAFIALGLLYS